MTKKGFLKAAFAVAAAGVAVGALAVLAPTTLPYFAIAAATNIGTDLYLKHKEKKTYPTPPGTSLTGGEIALVKSIFGKGVDTKPVKKYLSPKQKPNVAAQVFGKKIKFYGTSRNLADYSQAQDPFNYGTFMHEITHIWQNQRPLRSQFNFWSHYPSRRKYTYTLSEKSRFKKFAAEQQASIIQDYVMNFLYAGPNPYKFANRDDIYAPVHDKVAGSTALLKKVVEDKFPEARKTRLALEAQRKSSASAPKEQSLKAA